MRADIPATTRPAGDPRPADGSRFDRFGILATCVAGRRVHVAGTDHDGAYADADVIHLPWHIGPRPQATVVAQALLLAGASLQPRIAARLVGRGATRQRYLTLEVARVARALHDTLPDGICRAIAAIYDGPLPDTPDQSALWAAQVQRRIPPAPDWYGVIRPMAILRQQAPLSGNTPSERDLRRALNAPEQAQDEDDDAEHDRPKLLSLFASSAIQNPLMGRFLQSILGGARTPASDDSGSIGLSASGLRQSRVGGRAKALRGGQDLAVSVHGDGGTASVGMRYPEWDCHAGRYRPDHCVVTEFSVDTAGSGTPPGPGHDRQLLRQLARTEHSLDRCRGQYEGDNVDIDAAVRHLTSCAAGGAGEPRLFIAQRAVKRDLGVLVLLDASSSTNDIAGGTSIFDEQRRVVARLAASFERLGDRVAIGAFYSRGGASAVRFLRIKHYEERLGPVVSRRLSSLRPSGFTRLGAAIRHATRLVDAGAGTRHRLLIVVGDGLPYDDGYENAYAQADCRKALGEALRSGTGCVGISVGAPTHADVLARVWGHVPHERFRDASDAARHIRRLIAIALRQSATAQRRIPPPSARGAT